MKRSEELAQALKGVRSVYKHLDKHYPSKQVVGSVYSETMETDEMGRWQRQILYNGLLIATISGFIKDGDKIYSDRKHGTVEWFFTILNFPTNNSHSKADRGFDNLDDAIKYATETFKLFLKHVNK